MRMIRTSPNLTHRAAALVAAAVFSFTTHHASAQQTVDLFGGTLGSPAMLSLVGNGISTNQSTSGAFGPGYNGTASFGVATVSDLTEGFTSLTTGPNATNSFYVNQTGILGVAGATTATKTFGVSLTPGATYALTLTRTTGFTVGLPAASTSSSRPAARRSSTRPPTPELWASSMCSASSARITRRPSSSPCLPPRRVRSG